MLFQTGFEFVRLDQKERETDLRRFLGHYLILYFFPRAGTPGCTKEARDFQALLPEFSRLDAIPIGIAPDSPQALRRFSEGNGLGFPLLSDPDLKMAEAFGAKREGKVQRATFLVDRVGVVRHAWPRVKVEGHAEEVLGVLHELYARDSQINPLINARRARRALSPDPISNEDIARLIEAAHLAPSCFNNQPWRFVVAQGEALERVRKALPGGNYWALAAPVIIAVASHPDLDCRLSDHRDYFLFDCGMAVGFLMVQATQMGLIAHPIAGYDPLTMKEALGIPEDHVLITLVVLGRPGDPEALSEKHREIELGPRQRKPISAVLGWNAFPKEEK